MFIFKQIFWPIFGQISPYWTISNWIGPYQTKLSHIEKIKSSMDTHAIASTVTRRIRANPTQVCWPNWHTHASLVKLCNGPINYMTTTTTLPKFSATESRFRTQAIWSWWGKCWRKKKSLMGGLKLTTNFKDPLWKIEAIITRNILYRPNPKVATYGRT